MVNFQYKEFYDVEDLKTVIDLLRSKDGCPWDREQTHNSIRRNFLEEAYEVCEAIDNRDCDNLKEELGDVLMQVVFHSSIEEQAGRFDLSQVADTCCKKLIYRHPHVFGNVNVSDTDNVLENWDQLKRREKKQETTASVMNSIARSLPSTWRAEKIQGKAKKSVGFDWEHISGAVDKLYEEVAELKEAIEKSQGTTGQPDNSSDVREELGDVLFSAVNVARMANIDPEDVLHASCDKFITRFKFMEQEALKQNRQLDSMSLDELEAIYQLAKSRL